jgi:NADH-quinone oxidoreductase subunit M
VVLAAALNGIALVKAYFLLFTGTRHVSSVPLQVTWREKVAVLTLAALILGGGLYPQPGVASRHHAALELLEERALNIPVTPDHTTAERDSDRHDATEHNEWLLE